MTDRLYIQPLTLVASPQAVGGDAIRLAGGMAYAREFAVTVVRDGEVVQRELATAETIERALERLPDDLGPAISSTASPWAQRSAWTRDGPRSWKPHSQPVRT